jgi:hypothetical protein
MLFQLAKLSLSAKAPAMCVYSAEYGYHAMCVPSEGDEPLDDEASAKISEYMMEGNQFLSLQDVLGITDQTLWNANQSATMFAQQSVATYG